MRWLALLALLSAPAFAKPSAKPAPPPPAPQASFADLLDEAESVGDLGKLIDPLFDTCDTSDPLAKRQCEGERTFLESQARGKTYVAIGDAAALEVLPYDAAAKEVDFEVQGCLACVQPITLTDGKGGEVKRFFTTKAPRAIKNGRAIGVDVDTLQLTIAKPADDASWKKHEKQIGPRLRVQFVFKLGDTWTSGAFTGAGFVPLGYRVFDACSGEVLVTHPPLADDAKPTKVAMPIQLAAGDSLTCPKVVDDRSGQSANVPEFLTAPLIERALATVKDKVHKCHQEFSESGTVNVRFVVEGASGRVAEVDVAPPFDQTPAGACVRAAVKGVRFSHFKGGETQEVKFPIYLR